MLTLTLTFPTDLAALSWSINYSFRTLAFRFEHLTPLSISHWVHTDIEALKQLSCQIDCAHRCILAEYSLRVRPKSSFTTLLVLLSTMHTAYSCSCSSLPVPANATPLPPTCHCTQLFNSYDDLPFYYPLFFSYSLLQAHFSVFNLLNPNPYSYSYSYS